VNTETLHRRIFQINSEQEFNDLSLQIFHFQYENNGIYKKYVDAIGCSYQTINHYKDIPFLPIEFFKTHQVVSTGKLPLQSFHSSGTGEKISKHFVHDIKLYEDSFVNGFNRFYGHPEGYVLLALLPSYLEQENSSLIYMAKKLMDLTNCSDSGFYLNHSEDLINLIHTTDRQPLLLGVSYALLDLADNHTLHEKNLVVMETGGMKGRRKEMVRAELHSLLKKQFNVPCVHSEYGMTELLSQAYSKGDGFFKSPPWMRVLIRDANDPLTLAGHLKTGGINVIDLANIYSCSFIATQDLGKTNPDGSFEVLGRFDTSDIRGCNLMVV